MIDAIGAVALGMISIVGATGFAIGRKSKRVPVRLEEDRCTGYRTEKTHLDEAKMKNDCKALRSPTCGDGRCSFHCQGMCRCDLATGRGPDGKFTKK